MTLHVETHTVADRRRKDQQREALLLVTDTGIVVAEFRSVEMAKLYIEQVALTWVFAHQAGRMGI